MQLNVKIQPFADRNYNTLIEIWESAVRSSHHFLSEKNIQDIRQMMPSAYLPAVSLYTAITESGQTAGFIGLAGDMIEMLFIRPEYQGMGIGSRFIAFAISKGFVRVDVNEQNDSALRFYLQKGFQVTGRSSEDPMGNPFPILHMEQQTPQSRCQQATTPQ